MVIAPSVHCKLPGQLTFNCLLVSWGIILLDSRASWGSAVLIGLGEMSHKHSSTVCRASSALAEDSLQLCCRVWGKKLSSTPKVSLPVINEALLFLSPSYFPTVLVLPTLFFFILLILKPLSSGTMLPAKHPGVPIDFPIPGLQSRYTHVWHHWY